MLVFLLLLFYSTSVCNNKDDDEIRGLVKHLCCSVLSSCCFIFFILLILIYNPFYKIKSVKNAPCKEITGTRWGNKNNGTFKKLKVHATSNKSLTNLVCNL